MTTLTTQIFWLKHTNMYDVVVDNIKWRLGLKINKKKIVK